MVRLGAALGVGASLAAVFVAGGCDRWETCGPAPEWSVDVHADRPLFAGSAAGLVGAATGMLLRYDRDGALIASGNIAASGPPTYVGIDDLGRVLVVADNIAIHYTDALEPDWQHPASAVAIGPGGDVAMVDDTLMLADAAGASRWTVAVPVPAEGGRWNLRLTAGDDVLVWNANGAARLAGADATSLPLSDYPFGSRWDHVATDGEDVVLAHHDAAFVHYLTRFGPDGIRQWEFVVPDQTYVTTVGVLPRGDILALAIRNVTSPQARIGAITHDMLLARETGARIADRERCAWQGDLVATDNAGFVVLTATSPPIAELTRYSLP